MKRGKIMSTKVFNTRLQLKYAPYSEWSAEANQFKLLAGEIAIVNVPAETGAVVSEPSILFKVGDGEKTFNQLPWASGLAADVYGWAKAENKPEYIASEITVTDEKGYFGNTSVEGVLKEIWETVSEMTGGTSSAGSIASQIANGIAALGSVSAADGKYVSGVKVVDGKLAIEEKDLPDYSNTYAAKTLEKTVADHMTAVAEYDTRITAAQNQADKGVADAAAAKSAADAAQVTANKAYVLPNGGIEADLSDAVKESLAKANTALQNHQDISHLATKDELGDVSDRVETIENDHLKAADKTELEGKITTVETNVKAYADDIKEAILGGEGLKDTFDTLLEIQTWIEGDGVNTTELTTAIAAETKAREEADEDFETRVSALEDKVDVEKVSTVISDAITAQAATDAATYETKTDAADKLKASKEYTDEKIGGLHTVATSGKLGDLENEGRATTADADYVIFYCGTASILTNPEVTE